MLKLQIYQSFGLQIYPASTSELVAHTPMQEKYLQNINVKLTFVFQCSMQKNFFNIQILSEVPLYRKENILTIVVL